MHRFLAKAHGRSIFPDLLQALDDPHPIVRENSIDLLDDMCATEAMSAIERHMSDEDPNVREAAAWAVRALRECEK